MHDWLRESRGVGACEEEEEEGDGLGWVGGGVGGIAVLGGRVAGLVGGFGWVGE